MGYTHEATMELKLQGRQGTPAYFASGMCCFALFFIIALTLPPTLSSLMGSDAACVDEATCWGSANQCGTSSDSAKLQCLGPLQLSAFVILLVAALAGTQKSAASASAFLAFVSAVLILTAICMKASTNGGYSFSNYGATTNDPQGGYEFFSDFAVLLLIIGFKKGRALHFMGSDEHKLRLSFAVTIFLFTFFICIQQWSMMAYINSGAGDLFYPDGSPHWETSLALSGWTIMWVGSILAIGTAASRNAHAGMGASCLLNVGILLVAIAIIGTLCNTTYNGLIFDRNTWNRMQAAAWFAIIGLLKAPAALAKDMTTDPEEVVNDDGDGAATAAV